LYLQTNLAHDENVTIQIFDALGKKVFSENRDLATGNNTLDFNVNLFSKGLYYVRIAGNNETLNGDAVFVKQ